MGKLFGTDGIRGIVGEDLTCELAMKVGQAASYILGKTNDLVVLIGRDTRVSGQMLVNAISSGLMSQGAKVIDLGIIPTPAVSYLIKKYNASMGVMVTASHNPANYNGIKLFDNNGIKLPDAIENEIEKYLLGKSVPTSKKVGTYEVNTKAIEDYTNFLVSIFENAKSKYKILVDCAFGSASTTAPILFKKLGLNVKIINNLYDGYNINQNAGSTCLKGLIEEIKKNKFDIGIAYDGDADRCLMVDSKGNIVDGDQLMAICTNYLKTKNMLKNNTLVGTIMSNLGLSKFCINNDINFVTTKVGDRYVLEKMIDDGYIIGGEQSGHIIFKKYANAGDGELTSIIILKILNEINKTLEDANIMKKYPQVLLNVDVKEEGKTLFENDSEIIDRIKKVENELGNDGRVLVRASGTESIIRVMIEGIDSKDINNKALFIKEIIEKKYGKNN